MTSTSAPVDGKRLSLYHKWTPGDGKVAIDAVVEAFNEQSTAAVTEQSCANLGLEMKTSILKEQPPELWMEWPGRNLAPYQDAGILLDVGQVWDDANVRRNLADGIVDIVSPDGEYFPIPTTVHRVNNLFYDVERAERHGVDPGRIADPRELVEVLEQVDDQIEGNCMVQPMKNPETVLQLWETTFLGLFDVSTYESMTDGAAERHRSEIRESLDVLASVAEFAPEDAVFTSFTDANRAFIDGESVFFQGGDWAAEMYAADAEFEYERDWNQVPFPGTDGTYDVVMDAAMATDATELSGGTKAFLEFVGSPEGQRVFNEPKGSIPPRTDVDMSSFPPFLQDQYEEFQRARELPGTITHGLAVTPAQHTELMGAAANFIARRDPSASVDEFVAAMET